LNLLGLYYERQHKYSSAIVYLRRALDLFANSENDARRVKVIENLARCLCSDGQFEESSQLYAHLVGSTGDAYCCIGAGTSLYFSGRLEDSLVSFQKALDISLSDSANIDVLLQNDVSLLLSQVLYALGSETHLGLAKQQLLEWYVLS
jgi:tetratricopeptide (TPR) repeat protein